MLIHVYGVIIALGILVGAGVAERVRKKWYPKLSSVGDVLPWIVVAGVVGARLYHVVDLWAYYRENWVLIPQVWTGGLGIFGAILGAIFGLGAFSVWEQIKDRGLATLRTLKRPEVAEIKTRLLGYLDLLAIGAPLGQAIGRWGNYFNQELYGLPFDFAQGKPPFYAIYITPENRLPGYEQFSHFHPLFFYESLWNVLILLVLLWVLKRNGQQLKNGTLFTLYVIFYSLGRFFLERLRIDPWMVMGVPVAQIVSGVLLVVSGLVLWRREIAR